MLIAGHWPTWINSYFTTLYLLHCFNFGVLKHLNPVDLFYQLWSGEVRQNAQKKVAGTFLINRQRINTRDASGWLRQNLYISVTGNVPQSPFIVFCFFAVTRSDMSRATKGTNGLRRTCNTVCKYWVSWWLLVFSCTINKLGMKHYWKENHLC